MARRGLARPRKDWLCVVRLSVPWPGAVRHGRADHGKESAAYLSTPFLLALRYDTPLYE